MVICLLVAAPERSSSEFVWTYYNNLTGWDGSQIYVIFIGLLFSLFSFSGYEAGAHMAEETTHASKSAPFGIFYTCIATMLTGFCYLLGLLYAMNGDIKSVLLPGLNDQPIVNVF